MADAWATGNSLSGTKYGLSGCGSSAALLVAGGITGSTSLSASEEMNGLTWAAGGSMAGARQYCAGYGSQTAADMVAGGLLPGPSTLLTAERYDGTAFSTGASLGGQRYQIAGCGTQSSAMTCGGSTNGTPSAHVNTTDKSNGSTWTSSGNLPYVRGFHAVSGSSSAAFACTGGDSSGTGQSTCANFNGTTWATSGAVPQALRGASAFGAQSSGVCSGGFDAALVTASYLYNGATWSTAGSLNVARHSHAAGGGVAVAGYGASAELSSIEIYGVNFPSAFGFADVAAANLSTVTTSDTVAPSGYNVTVAWTCSGGTASISGGAFASSGTINPGQTVQLKVTSSALYATAVSATVTIGGVSDTWYVTTRNAPIPQIMIM